LPHTLHDVRDAKIVTSSDSLVRGSLFGRPLAGSATEEQAEKAMKIWVDADASPRDVKDIIARAALRLELETKLVANHRLQTPANNPFVTAVRVEGGPDVADDHIAEQAEPGDLAITADIPLAARLVAKGVSTIDPRGPEYTEENIRERLSVRDFMDQLRSTGIQTGGPDAFGPKEKQAFAASLDRVLTRLLRNNR